ncbi:MAG TPA: head GIN domain-containing protein [Chitinophagaceae bacterium]|nr:head GIN domain-containing protein [Chitinophagaceae bacterium]
MKKMMVTAGFIMAAIITMAQDKVVKDANAETRKVESFHGVSVSGAIELYVSQGPQAVAVSAASQEDVDKIITEVEDGILKIRFKDKKSWWSDQWNTTGRKFKAYVSAEQLDYLAQSGSGNIRIEGTLKSPELNFEVSGSGNIYGDIQTKDLKVRASGSSNIKLSGTASNAEFSCSGSGNINAPGLNTDICEVNMSGSGNAELTVNKELSATISGSGNIRYGGSGNLVNSSTSGSGRIRKI